MQCRRQRFWLNAERLIRPGAMKLAEFWEEHHHWFTKKNILNYETMQSSIFIEKKNNDKNNNACNNPLKPCKNYSSTHHMTGVTDFSSFFLLTFHFLNSTCVDFFKAGLGTPLCNILGQKHKVKRNYFRFSFGWPSCFVQLAFHIV